MTVNSKLILVTGATGQQGGAVAKSLLQKGQRIRVLTRNKDKAGELAKLGAEVVTGDMTDRASLKRAFEGVDRVFAVSTWFEGGMNVEVQQGISLATAAKEANVSHFVYTEVGGADRQPPNPLFESKRKVDEHIRQLGLRTTILRPVWFMENFGTSFRPSPEGKLVTPLRPDRKLQMIAVKDIGAFGAAALLRPDDFVGHTIELAGDELTPPEIAAQFSRTMGRSIQYQQMPEEQVEGAVGPDFAQLFQWLNTVGFAVDIAALKTRYDIALTSFAELIASGDWAKAA